MNVGDWIEIVEVLEASTGGTLHHLKDILSALSANEFRVRVVISEKRNPQVQRELLPFLKPNWSLDVLPMARSIRPLQDFRAYRKVRRYLQEHPCDVLHLHSSKAGLLGRLASWGLPCATLYTPHAFAFQQRVSLPLRIGYFLAEKIAAFRPGHLHVVSDHESELATKFRLYPESRIHCLPNAVAYSPRPTRYARFHDFPRTFGFIGELRKQKDPVTFVRAIREVVNRGVVARFLIPDQGPLFGQIQASIQRFGLHHCVDFVPTRESLSALLEQTDVAVLPSLWEGHPYSLLEAMAQGVPTIISDIPSLRVFIRDAETKQVFRAGDSHHLAQRIVDWASLDQATLERAGSMSRREVWNRYDFEQWGARLREIYRELAGHT